MATLPTGIVNISLAEKDPLKINFAITQALARLQTISASGAYTDVFEVSGTTSSTDPHSFPLLILRSVAGTDGAGAGIIFNCLNSNRVEHTAAFINGGFVSATAGSERGLIDYEVYDGANTANRIITQQISTSGDGDFAPGTDDNYWNLGLPGFRWKKLYSYAADFSTNVSIGGSLSVITPTTAVNAEIAFFNVGTPKWEIGKDASDEFFIFDDAAGSNAVTIGSNGGAITLTRNLTLSAVPIQTGTFTVGTLPTAATGMVARVSDGVSGAAWGTTISGSSSTYYLLNYNGSKWTVIGK